MARVLEFVTASLAIAAVFGCTSPPAAASSQHPKALILAKSSPAAGSNVRGTVDRLKLTFSPPARLQELKIRGSKGTVPMMVLAVGEVADYDLPLPDLEPGSYSIEWNASVGDRHYSGTFLFTVSK